MGNCKYFILKNIFGSSLYYIRDSTPLDLCGPLRRPQPRPLGSSRKYILLVYHSSPLGVKGHCVPPTLRQGKMSAGPKTNAPPGVCDLSSMDLPGRLSPKLHGCFIPLKQQPANLSVGMNPTMASIAEVVPVAALAALIVLLAALPVRSRKPDPKMAFLVNLLRSLPK